MRACAAARWRRSTLRPRRIDIFRRCAGVLLGSGLQATLASAQLSGTVSVVSDYRFRGVSLSEARPALQATLAVDEPGGWYGGIFASTVQLPATAHTSAQGVAFIGFAGQLEPGLHWDAGVNYSAFTKTPEYDYVELHGGVTWGDLSVRIHFSPSYFALDSASFYGEINAARRLSDRFTLLLHSGLLVPIGHSGYVVQTPHPMADIRAGINVQFSETAVQLAWVAATHAQAVYPGLDEHRRQTVVASISRAF